MIIWDIFHNSLYQVRFLELITLYCGLAVGGVICFCKMRESLFDLVSNAFSSQAMSASCGRQVIMCCTFYKMRCRHGSHGSASYFFFFLPFFCLLIIPCTWKYLYKHPRSMRVFRGAEKIMCVCV